MRLTRVRTDEANPPPLIGRGAERAQLLAHLDAAIAGRGGLVIVAAEAGAGKSALMQLLSAEARVRGVQTAAARGDSLMGLEPYALWDDLRGGVVAGEIAMPDVARMAGESERERYAAMESFLAASSAHPPLLLILEDLQWTDRLSLRLLHYLARQVHSYRVLLVGTYRPAPNNPKELTTLLFASEREGIGSHMQIGSVATEVVRTLVYERCPGISDADADRLVTWLDKRAGGNPSFLLAWLKDLEQSGRLTADHPGWQLGELTTVGIPRSISWVIEENIAALGDEAKRLLVLASMFDGDVPIDTLMSIGAVDEVVLLDVIEAATAAKVLTDARGGQAVRFTRAIVRDVLYESVLPARRRALHRRIGELLAADERAEPEMVAEQFNLAGDARAAMWYVRASERARLAFEWIVAADRLGKALTVMDAAGADPVDRALLRVRRAWLLRSADPRAGLDDLDVAARLAASRGDGAMGQYILACVGLLRGHRYDFRTGIPILASAIAAIERLPAEDRRHLEDRLPSSGAVPTLATLVPSLALHRAFVGQLADAETLARESLVALEAEPYASHEIALASAYLALAVVHAGMRRPAEAREALAAARLRYQALGEEHGLSWVALIDMIWIARIYWSDDIGEWQRLTRALTEAWERSGGIRITPPSAVPALARVIPAALNGDWLEALRIVAERDAFSSPVTAQRRLVTHVLALIAFRQGDLERMWRLVEEELPAGPATEPGGTHFVTANWMQRFASGAALMAGDRATALRWLEMQDRWLAWSGAEAFQAHREFSWALYYHAGGDSARALTHCEAGLAAARNPRQPTTLFALHLLLSQVLRHAGRVKEAEESLAEARAIADRGKWVYEQAQVALAAAEFDLLRDDLPAARAKVATVRAVCDPLGARPALLQAEALERRIDEKIERTPQARFSLSAREVQVLELVAEGMSNADVAAQLVISPHTVNTHLTRIYRKIGVPSRSAAMRLAIHYGLTRR